MDPCAHQCPAALPAGLSGEAMTLSSKPYYQDGSVTIYHGDCREILPTVSADVLVTDPPYGISFNNAGRIGAPGAIAMAGGVYGRDWGPIHGDDKPFDPSPLVDLGLPSIIWGAQWFASRLPDSGGWLVWDKKRGGTVAAELRSAEAELAWTNVRGTVQTFSYLWVGFMREGEIHEHHHPTQKPLALMKWCLDFVPDGTVIDPYMGSGTTLRAAKDLGRKAIGIEIEERFCEIAVKRLSQETLGLSA